MLTVVFRQGGRVLCSPWCTHRVCGVAFEQLVVVFKCSLWLFRGLYANTGENFRARRVAEFVHEMSDTPLELVISKSTQVAGSNPHPIHRIVQNLAQRVQGSLKIPNLKRAHVLSSVCSSSL